MNDNFGEWVESMGVVFRRWVWLECIDVVSGCCCKEVYAFPHNNTYRYLFHLFLLFLCRVNMMMKQNFSSNSRRGAILKHKTTSQNTQQKPL